MNPDSKNTLSDLDKSFVLSPFSTQFLIELGVLSNPHGIVENARRFLNRKINEAVSENERNERESEISAFLKTFP